MLSEIWSACTNRRIFCASEMWLQIAHVLTPENAHDILNALPQEVQVQLRAVYLDSPSLPREGELAAVCRELARWCEQAG